MDTLTAIFISMSAKYDLPPDLLSSICWIESRHNPNAIHHDDGNSGSIGICQIKLKTATWLGYKGDAKGLFDAKTNIEYAAKYLSYQLKRYNGVADKAVIAYNRGNATDLVTSKYQRKVFTKWRSKNEVSTRPTSKMH